MCVSMYVRLSSFCVISESQELVYMIPNHKSYLEQLAGTPNHPQSLFINRQARLDD